MIDMKQVIAAAITPLFVAELSAELNVVVSVDLRKITPEMMGWVLAHETMHHRYAHMSVPVASNKQRALIKKLARKAKHAATLVNKKYVKANFGRLPKNVQVIHLKLSESDPVDFQGIPQ